MVNTGCTKNGLQKFIRQQKPSIEFLELYAVTAAVLSWIHQYKNSRIILFCDNQSVVDMINITSTSCRHCMVLIRMIVLKGLIENVRILLNISVESKIFMLTVFQGTKYNIFINYAEKMRRR